MYGLNISERAMWASLTIFMFINTIVVNTIGDQLVLVASKMPWTRIITYSTVYLSFLAWFSDIIGRHLFAPDPDDIDYSDVPDEIDALEPVNSRRRMRISAEQISEYLGQEPTRRSLRLAAKNK